MGAVAGDELFEWTESFVWPWSPIVMLTFALTAWACALFVLDLARAHVGAPGRVLAYGKEGIMPFYLIHQPVIIVIAYFVVQWEAGIVPKMIVVVGGSFAVTVILYEVLIRRIGPMRTLFGMKQTASAPR